MTTFPIVVNPPMFAALVHAERYTTDPVTVDLLTKTIKTNVVTLAPVLEFIHRTLLGRLHGGPTYRSCTDEQAWSEALAAVRVALGYDAAEVAA